MISFFATLLTFAAVPGKRQIAQRPASSGISHQGSQRSGTASESAATPKRKTARKSERVEITASRQRVRGREITGFSARQMHAAQDENLTPPAGLKPVEQEAWLAMAHRQQINNGTGFESFYPVRYGEPFVVENGGVRVAVQPVGGTAATAQIDKGRVIYREAYPETNSVHVVGNWRSEEFLYLQSECAPREFAYEISEVSPGTRVEVVNGEVHFTNKLGQDRKSVV